MSKSRRYTGKALLAEGTAGKVVLKVWSALRTTALTSGNLLGR